MTTTAFRPEPDASASEGGHGIFGALSTEWARLCAMPSMARTLTRWGRSEPALAGASTLHELLARIDASGRSDTDALLLALIRLTRDGHQLAGRVVLQAMLPKLSAMVRTSRMSGADAVTVEDRRHVAIATFWEVLSGYPVNRRQRGVAGNLALDTLHRLTAPQRRRVTEIPVHPLDRSTDRTEIPSDPMSDAVDDVGSISSDASLRELVAWGQEVRAITPHEGALLVRVYAPAPGQVGGPAAAADLGLSPAAVRQRCSRARHRLIDAVHADLNRQAALPAAVAV